MVHFHSLCYDIKQGERWRVDVEVLDGVVDETEGQQRRGCWHPEMVQTPGKR